ncbi:uncharacterized protein Z519_09190 [Cladophialophora bantiana CBS 173.52]|uniref:Uncharacterized protein n=1 Tax=Cladophialophora bantiana (strain ATCC 10958 / CBS 173.52 / CDC B-1940 / NIH 8579) TaxID=1442370 RepID=A0A0D2HBF1_CLAB1|nr:uncharacterized protein Z519_09190 [Cladophialophora bantiana CBS 173.52]KIW90543.1 hypothetical protein Z519_09190 [Cladophialophora bantiana CBS 173.52]
MGEEDYSGRPANDEAMKENIAIEAERVGDMDTTKTEGDDFAPDEGKRLVRKPDFWLLPLMMMTYMLQSYDKGIMSAATQFNFNSDLELTTIVGYQAGGKPITNNQKYLNAAMMIYIGYLVGTYPMIYLSQHYPTSKVLSLATFLWGAVVMSTAGCSNHAGIMLNRFFLGFLKSTVAPAFTGQINTSMPHWKPMFLILGAVTLVWSIVLFFALPDSPLTTKRLTESERRIVVCRLERNNAGTISRKFNKGQFLEAFRDYKLYSCTLIILLTGVPSGALGTFGTVVINGFGFDHFDSLALTCPIGAVTATSILFVGYVMRKWNSLRYLSIVTCALISIAGTFICWLVPRDNRGLLFAAVFLIAVQVSAGGVAVSLAASNIAGHTMRVCLCTFTINTLTSWASSIASRTNVNRQLLGCGKDLPGGQNVGEVSNVTITSDGNNRSYLIFIPPASCKDTPTSAIVSYYGGARTAEDQLDLDLPTSPEFNTKSFVVYPQGSMLRHLQNTWQGVPGVTMNDLKFTTDILNEIESLYCIDPSRIYTTGKSDGAGFCNLLACDPDLSTALAAFAPVSGAYFVDSLPCMPTMVDLPCSPGRSQIPVLAFHGGNDTAIPYTGKERKGECLPSIPHFIQEWALREGLGTTNITTPVANDTVKYTYGMGHDAGFVAFIFDSDIGHDWPSTAPNGDNQHAGHHPASSNATPIILDFFQHHRLI